MLQPKRKQQLDANIQELIKNGGSNEDVDKMAKDFVAKFGNEAKPTPTPRATTQKKNPVQNGVGNTENGSSASQEIDPKTGFPKIDANGPLPNFEEMKSVSVAPKSTLPPKGNYAKKIADKAFSEYDPNITEERLQTEKEQSGILNNVSKGAKAIWNVTGEALGAVNETFGGDSDYFTIDEYKPLQDEKKQYLHEAFQQGLPVTEDAIQKGAEAIFRKNDRIQQVEKRIDANLPEDYDRQGIWKDLKLDNLKKNDKLRSAVASIDIYQTEVEEFNKYAAYVQNLPKEQLTQAKIDKHNSLLDRAKQGTEALEYYRDNFPKLLEEVKSSDELLDVMKYNYNDYEKHYSNIKNFLKTTGAGTLKIAAETASYIDQKTDEEGVAPTTADKTFKKIIQAAKDVANEDLDEAEADRKQYAHYKAKDINNVSDFGSYLAQLTTEQAPIWATLAVAPTMGLTLMGTQSAGTNFRNMEIEEMQPFAKTTSFGQKLATSYLYGFAEAGFERIGTVSIIKNMQRSFAKASLGSRRLIQDSFLKQTGTLGKQLGFNFNLEGGTEYLTAEAQIGADRYIAGKDISSQQANERRSESYIAGGFMGGGMTLMGGALGAVAQKARLYSDGKDIARTQEILSKIKDLDDEVKNNPNLTKEDIKIIQTEMNNLMTESFDIVTNNAEKEKNFGRQENIFLVKINTLQEGLKAEFEKIKNSNLSKEQKEKFTKDLNDQFNQFEQDRQTTLKGEFASIPDIRKNISFENKPNNDNLKLDGITPLNDDETGVNSLPLKEREALKKQAMESLIAELNPDGKKDITITDEQVVERANEIYKNEQTPTPGVPQQAEAEKVSEASPKVADIEKEIKELEDVRDNGQPLKPLMFEEDYSQEQLDNAEKKHQRDVKEHISDINKQIAQKQAELEALKAKETPKPQEVSPVEDVVAPQDPTDEELLNDLEDNEDTSTTEKEALPEINDQEYLDFVENDFLSDERLNDVAVKVRENKDLTTYEKRIAKKKEKEISAINQKVQDEVNETNRKAEVDTLSKIPSMEKDEFLEYTNSEKATPERLTAIAYKNANNVALNNFEKEVYQDNKKVVDKINRDRNLKENILDKIPTDQKYQTQEGKYTVAKNGNEFELYDTNGQPVTLSPKTKQKYFLEALENGFMKRTEDLQIPEGITESEIETFEIENETDPSVILEKLLKTEPKVDGSIASDVKEYAIALYINKVTQSSFVRFGDKNNITRGIALTYFSKEGREIDTLAQEISGDMDIDVTPQDVVDFIIANPNGKRNILTVKNPTHQSLIDKFVELTGFRPTPSQIAYFKLEVKPTQIDIEFANEVEVNNKIDDDIVNKIQAQDEFDKWFSNLTQQEQVEFYFDLDQEYPNAYYQQRYNEQQEYEQSKEITSTETPNTQGETKLDDSVGQNAQQDRPGSGNNNVSERSSGKTQTEGVDLENLQKEYESKTVEELVALKKKLYPNPDIESPMLPEEKLLDKVIAQKIANKDNNRNLALNKTQDGQEFLSLSEPGSEYSNSSQPNLWQQGDKDSGENNRRSVRAVWTKYKNLQFKGTTKIKNAEDVAQIMSLLENKAVEHAFAIHIDQKGNSHIQFLSIGGVTGTVVDTNIIAAGVTKFNSKKVYLVHNHPSGRMIPSDADLQITKTLRDGLNPLGITVEHVIMDTYLKEYIHIDNDNLFTVNTRGENTFTKALTPIALTEQEILGNHFGKVTEAAVAFSIIQNFRFSAFPKNAMLVLNNANEVIGNYVFSNGDITYKEVVDFLGETATAKSIIFYGNQANNLSEVKDFQKGLTKLSINVLDKIVTSSDNDAVQGYYESMTNSGMLNEHQEQYGTGNQKFNEVNEPSANKDLRLPQTIARQALDQIREDKRNNVPTKDLLKNAVSLIQNTDWYNNLEYGQQARVNNTTVKSLLENAIKELNYLEDKIQEYKEQIRDKKITARQIFDDIIAFLKTNQIKGRITPTEINRLIKTAAQITIKRDTEKALDDFMNLYEVIKEKALLRSDKGAREKAEVEYVVPIVEMLVESGYELEAVLDYFETNSQKRMAEIQYHKEKSKFATEEERVNKAEEALKKQKQDLFNATYTSFREGLKKARLYWFNLISDRSYVPAELMSQTGMQQTYYQFKNTKGYGHSAKEMYEKVYDKVWKGLTQEKIQLLHDTIQMMRIITIDNNREQNGLAPVQHPNNLSNIDAQAWLDNQKLVLGDKKFNDIQKRANEYFNAYTEVLNLKLENGFISDETYEALNGLDYQPRMFLHHAVNFDGDLSFEQTRSIETRSGLSKEQVLKLDDGSANSLISDAQWLLSNSISTLYQDIADNNLNKLFIAEELPIAQAKYDELLSGPQDQLSKEETRFIKYFKELSEKVIPNEIIGFSANTNDPVYKNDTPKHFVNKYYWADGVKHQFFMEEKLAQEFDGAKGLFLNESNKATVGNLTGARLVKYFATGNNPLFVIVNTPRDFMWNILVSEHYSSVVPLAMAQMTYQLFPSTYDFIRTKLGRENTDMNLYLQHGGSMDYLHKQGDIADKSFADKYIVKPLTSVLGKNNQPRVEDAIKNNYIIKVVGALNEWSELAFRIATFRRSINAQLKELGFENESQITDLIDENGMVTQTKKEILDNIYRKATYDARSILDFSQGGRLIKDMEEFVPYLNVGVQATRSYADAMKKRPISTTLKTFQIATGGAAAFIALAMFMLAGDDDEPEEEKGKTVERKYVEFMQGVSQETRSKYYLIPTKKRDEDGNRIAYKIAKDQLLIPYTNIVETLIENRIRTRAGFKEVSGDKIGNRLYKDILEYNLSAKTIKDVPLFKAGTAWYAGYDLYRNKPLDKYAKAEALEGMNNPQVEDFYKHLGAQWKVSPIRTKSAIESMITSPQSNPYLATGYEVMDYAFTDKSMSSLGSGVKEMLLKGLKNRTTTKSTEWTRAENLLSDKKKEQLDAMLKEEATRQLFKDKAQEVIEGKATAEKVLQGLEKQYGGDPNYRSYTKSFRSEIKGELREEGTDGMMQRIKREKSPGAKAIMIKEIYGDINSPENEEIKNELIGKRIINAATMRYLEKKTAN